MFLAAALFFYQLRHGIAAERWIQGLTAAGVLFGGLGLLTVFARSDVVAPYAQALRIIAKNSMLWVMFLACMSTSVFFSFDSRFNAVFPKDQRERVAQLRAENQVDRHRRRHRRNDNGAAARANGIAVQERGLAYL